jgi:HEAT repeat protein
MLGLPPLPRTLAAALRDVSSSKKPEVRGDAIRDLLRHADGERGPVVRALEGALRDADPRVRALAATGLSEVGANEALPALLVLVEDEDAYVRQMAIAALGEIGDARATERLRRALSDARPEVRFQAVMAFPRVVARKEDARAAILAALADDDALVVHIALRMAEETTEHAADAEVLGRARALLAHEALPVRIAAAILLAREGDDSGRDMIAKVASGELRIEEGEDEATAIELAGELGLKAAERGLERRAFGGLLGLGRDKFRWHARVALARLGNERAIRDIVADLASWDRERRSLAVAAAGRAKIGAARDKLLALRDGPDPADHEAAVAALRALDEKPAK